MHVKSLVGSAWRRQVFVKEDGLGRQIFSWLNLLLPAIPIAMGAILMYVGWEFASLDRGNRLVRLVTQPFFILGVLGVAGGVLLTFWRYRLVVDPQSQTVTWEKRSPFGSQKSQHDYRDVDICVSRCRDGRPGDYWQGFAVGFSLPDVYVILRKEKDPGPLKRVAQDLSQALEIPWRESDEEVTRHGSGTPFIKKSELTWKAESGGGTEGGRK